MDLGLKAKCVLVTGGSHGIGLATAKAFAREGCSVAVCSRSETKLSAAAAELQSFGVPFLTLRADVTKPTEIGQTVDYVSQVWGTIHVLVNNVGGGGRWGSANIEETSESVWEEVYAKNAMAAVRFTRLCLPHMRKQKWGRIVTVGSILGKEGGGRPWFNMAKSAEISLMKTLAMTKYLVRDGVTFNTVAPGLIMIPDTGTAEEQRTNPEGFSKWVDATLPLGRPGTPEEVADVIVFLCSERASLVNGATVTVDGAESRSF